MAEENRIIAAFSNEVFTELRELRKINEKQSEKSDNNYKELRQINEKHSDKFDNSSKELNDKIDKVENSLTTAIHNVVVDVAKGQTASKVRISAISFAIATSISILGLVIGLLTK